MRGGLVLAARCTLAVVVTTLAVQLWGMALQDDVPLPAPIFSLPATDDAGAAATPKGRVHRSQPAVVVSAGLLVAARQPLPEKSGGQSAPPAAEPATTPVTPESPVAGARGPQVPKEPDLRPPPRPAAPTPAAGPPTSSPQTVPLSPPPGLTTPPELHGVPSGPRTEAVPGPGVQSHEHPH